MIFNSTLPLLSFFPQFNFLRKHGDGQISASKTHVYYYVYLRDYHPSRKNIRVHFCNVKNLSEVLT